MRLKDPARGEAKTTEWIENEEHKMMKGRGNHHACNDEGNEKY